ncbi:MAG TPA: glycosyltransferase [Candidatus Saccharimonadales bacterium]|nr:glycosyltransferase [Candidatus Saccharimonadales bacterium]
MRSPKVLAVASAADLDFRYGCTPAWWQLWKALAESGIDLIVTPYRGRAVESPWWRTVPNPLYREAEAFAAARGVAAKLRRQEFMRRSEHEPGDTLSDRTVRGAIWRYVTPRWRRHLEQTIEREGGVDAVIVFTVPMAHLRGIPTALRERFDVPVVYYDGDLPMSLPEYGGTDTSGFNYYIGADPGEYDLVVGNSEGALDRLRELGARRAETVHWAADPDLFRPRDVGKEADVFFYGHSDKFRREWMRDLIGEPSRRLPGVDFAIGGYDYRGDTGTARMLGRIPFNAFPHAISSARVNLNATRRAHAQVYASSTCRLFELAASGAAIVSNPLAGLERWFDPDRDLRVVGSVDEAVTAYGDLLADPGYAEELGQRARAHVLDEHTYGHRARQLLDVLGLGVPASARA